MTMPATFSTTSVNCPTSSTKQMSIQTQNKKDNDCFTRLHIFAIPRLETLMYQALVNHKSLQHN